MRFSYNELVRRTDAYLREKRANNRFLRAVLPERIFDDALWVWARRPVAVGIGWGVAWAIAPVPLQTIFAALCSLWRRGNIPVSVAACWLSFPGHQVFVWPLQWWVGYHVLRFFGWSSRSTFGIIWDAAAHLTQGWEPVLDSLKDLEIPCVAVELLTGCILTCAAAGFLAYLLTLAVWPKKG